MSLANQLENDLKKAMLERNKDTADLLRLIKAALKNEMISLKKQELSDQEVIKILKYEAKKRHDSIQQFTQGNRQDLADKEKQELDIMQKYLPAQMDEAAVRKIVEQVIAGMGQVAPSQFGQVMAAVMKKVQGQADGTLVSRLVKENINK